MRQKCSASRNKKEFPKIASQIFGKFRLISEDATFVSPFIRFLEILEETEQKCSASRNKKEFPKIASQIFGKFRLISEDATFVSPFIRFLEILEETETTFVPVPSI